MKKKYFAYVAFALAVIAFSAASSEAQGANVIQGRVVLPNNAPPSNPVKVTLTYNGRRIFEVFTDLSGRFSFTGLNKGTYQLTAEGDGMTFETTTVYAEVSAFGSSPQIFTQNIPLRLKSETRLPPAGVVSAEDRNLPERAKKAFEKGMKRAQDNKPEEAIKNFEEAIAAYPDYFAAHVAMGEQYGKLQRYDEATAAYRKAIEMKADRADGHLGLGVIFVKQKKYTEAISLLRRAAELDKASSTAYMFLGMAEMFTGDYQSAEVDLLRAYEIARPAIAHIYLANVYELRGEPAKAIEQLEAFIKENPDNPNSRQIREAIEKLRKKTANKK